MNDQIQAVRKMQAYIKDHLDEPISAAQLASASGYSNWHANRLFRYWMNITPADYIRKLRLSRAALVLRDEDVTIADAAYSVGFGSVDGFQRAFFKEFGCNPKEYAMRPSALYLFTPFGLEDYGERKENTMENKEIKLQIVSRPARKVMIKRGIRATEYFQYCEEVGCEIWGLLTSVKSLSGEPICLWLPEKYIAPGTSQYVQGVDFAMDSTFQVLDGFDVIELPACEYLMFQGEPFDDVDFEEAIMQVWKAEKEYDPSVIGYQWDEENPRIQMEPRGERGYIELMPIKK